jgi:hypothetical protein
VANNIFFGAGAYDIALYGSTVAMLFNKQLVQDLGIESLFNVVREGRWTFDKFAEVGRLARADLDGDGVMGVDDRHGYLAITRNLQPSFWIAGGVSQLQLKI